ncbi:MAG TPA: 23S rRNA (cytidine(2498)-2'-O)-methyltransferase RlmM [Rhodocyclaceae bacterium]|nr:23S rRNA (cytidine(2498)-2'-O)-methyltransferase RlmM [Rhodocyclaceae bacterium]HNC79034.1 23S rRNA (cytidine(2498)-2'-O)-methyltransferase RlmM [Rhodocyclaceae bacterium]HNE15110.1 23S rRNA (cytidine(2498)-2'-O)-methyltransferase RlmM [Rhodocyclaceae bacterium]HNI80511.1 23S rRNA (cytidine(2498)-2'-O)-methyltransferase RlmM [Rhodocyclaceae bacterium]
MSTPSPHCLALGALIQCRPGFEPDAAAELASRAHAARLVGPVSGAPRSGFCTLTLAEPLPRDLLQRRLDASQLVFSRQSFQVVAVLDDLPERDRLTPLVSAIAAGGERFCRLLLETPDTNEGKETSGFLRRFEPLLDAALRDAGLLRPDSPHLPRLHVFFANARHVWLGFSAPSDGSAWPMGIPRLRMPKDAPSRSTLKLAEAFLTLLTPDEQKATLRPGLQAVDLGAAPGGWSFQLASHGLRVTALDNGPLAPAALATGLIEHLRADGFTWKPRKPVEWMVCDMVEQPARIAPLMAEWLASGRCRRSLFNLKLPMKRRYEELERCRALIDQRLRHAGIKYVLRIKHLYHDREEVTCYLTRR